MAKKEPLPLNVKSAKRWLRHALIETRKHLSRQKRCQANSIIHRRVLGHNSLKRARIISPYLSFGSEVDTAALIDALLAAHKQVLLPVVSQGFRNPYFVRIQKGAVFRKTRHGPSEPQVTGQPFDFKSIDIVIVPGLAFDHGGGRLGFGGGVYDRLLRACPKALHIGLFFDCQRLARIPQEAHDRSLDIVMTESDVYNFSRGLSWTTRLLRKGVIKGKISPSDRRRRGGKS